MKDPESLNRKVAYFCYTLAALSLLSLVRSLDIVNVIISIGLGALWYQIGTGLLKKRNRWRQVALVLFGLTSLAFLSSIYLTIILPMFDPNVSSVGIGRWISLVLFVLCGWSFITLQSKRVRSLFISNAT